MRIALTGASGIVGGFFMQAAREAGHEIVQFDRHHGFRLGDFPDLSGCEALVHCAFSHAPGRYRGGEGDDPDGFFHANYDGSVRLFEAATSADVERILFLSSRAVHDGHPEGTALTDDLPARPANLYGEVKARAEGHLRGFAIRTTAIRATGVYGPGQGHKWQRLFADYLAGKEIPPRIGTEVHGADLAAAMLLLLRQNKPPRTVNASDLVLDRRDLLAEVQELSGCTNPLPPRTDASSLRVLHCNALLQMGWTPGGMERLRASLPAMLDPGPHL